MMLVRKECCTKFCARTTGSVVLHKKILMGISHTVLFTSLSVAANLIGRQGHIKLLWKNTPTNYPIESYAKLSLAVAAILIG